MSKKRAPEPKTKREAQDAFLDVVIGGWLPNGNKLPSRPASALSLKPGVKLMFECAAGILSACAIRDAWAFRAPVTTMERSAFDETARRCYTVFTPEGL